MFAAKPLKFIIHCLFILALLIVNRNNAAEQDNNPLVIACTQAYENQSLQAAETICQTGKAQASNINDSASHLAIVRILRKIYQKLMNHERVEQLFQEEKSIVTSKEELHDTTRAHGAYYYHKADFDTAAVHFSQGLKLAKQTQQPKLIATSFNDMGLVNLRNLNYKEALTYFLQSLKIKERLNLTLPSAITMRNIALVYYRISDNKNALKFYLQALKIYNQVLQQEPDNLALKNRIIHINTDLAAVYARLGESKLSETALHKVLSAITLLADTTTKMSRLIDLAEGLIEAKDYSIAKDLLYKSHSLLANKDEGNHSRIYYLLSKAEYETNNLTAASDYSKKSITMAEKFKDNLILLKVYALDANIKEKEGLSSSALTSFKKHAQLTQQSNESKFNDDLRQVKFRLQTELNEKLLLERDNALLVSEASNQKLALSLYAVLSLIVLLLLAFYYRAKLNQQKRQQLNIELQMHKTKLKELDKPLVNFKHLFKDVTEKILVCTDAGFLIYTNIDSLQVTADIQNNNIKQLSSTLNSELERSINAGTTISTEVSDCSFLQNNQQVKISPLINSEYYIFEFRSNQADAFDIAGKITIANRFAQSLNSLIIDKNDIGLLRPIIIDTMEMCVETWIRLTDSNKVEFAEQSGIWKVNIDEGRLRTRSLDKYLSINTLPKQPRIKNIIKTCHFLLAQQGLTESERETIKCYLNKILAFDKS